MASTCLLQIFALLLILLPRTSAAVLSIILLKSFAVRHLKLPYHLNN
jgi:hypothetical protein